MAGALRQRGFDMRKSNQRNARWLKAHKQRKGVYQSPKTADRVRLKKLKKPVFSTLALARPFKTKRWKRNNKRSKVIVVLCYAALILMALLPSVFLLGWQ